MSPVISRFQMALHGRRVAEAGLKRALSKYPLAFQELENLRVDVFIPGPVVEAMLAAGHADQFRRNSFFPQKPRQPDTLFVRHQGVFCPVTDFTGGRPLRA